MIRKLFALLPVANLGATDLALGADRGDDACTFVVSEFGEVSAAPDKAIESVGTQVVAP